LNNLPEGNSQQKRCGQTHPTVKQFRGKPVDKIQRS
jgi:hypothetical protein